MGIQYQGKTIKDVYYGGKRIYKGVQGSGAGTPKVFWEGSFSPVCFTATQNTPFDVYCNVNKSEANTKGKFGGLRVSNGKKWSVPTLNYNTTTGSISGTPTLSNVTGALIRSVDNNLRTLGKSPSLNVVLSGLHGPITITGNLSNLVANPDEYAFSYLFSRGFTASTVGGTVDASGLDFPDTFMCPYIYKSMFDVCTALQKAPVLPATTLAEYCYNDMFYGCTSLQEAPELPATNLASNCYQFMFCDCTKLATAPVLPATTLVDACYWGMFMNCSSLSSITVHFTDWGEDVMGQRYTQNWVAGVASSGTFYKPSALPTKFGDSYIPTGWTVVNID